MRPDEALAMLLAFSLLMVPFLLYAYLRFLRYRETIFLAERGLVRPEASPPGGKRRAFRWGIVLAALGVAFSCGLYPLGWMIDERTFLGFGPWMLPGFILLALGLALVLIDLLTGEGKGDGAGGASSSPGVPGASGRPAPAAPAAPAAPDVPSAPGTALNPAAQQPMEADAGQVEFLTHGDEAQAEVER